MTNSERIDKLIERKKDALFETEMDIRFIEKHRKDILNYDEKTARKELTKEKAKKEQDHQKINELSSKINDKLVKTSELNQLKEMQRELKLYIELLREEPFEGL